MQVPPCRGAEQQPDLAHEAQKRGVLREGAAAVRERGVEQLQAERVEVGVRALALAGHQAADELQQVQEGLQAHLCAGRGELLQQSHPACSIARA